MTDFRKIIQNKIDWLEDLASSENNEGREREEEIYLFAKECLENLLEDLLTNEEEIRADERRKFTKWLCENGFVYASVLLEDYENEQKGKDINGKS